MSKLLHAGKRTKAAKAEVSEFFANLKKCPPCKCFLCERQRHWENIRRSGDVKRLRKLVLEIEEELTNAEFELSITKMHLEDSRSLPKATVLASPISNANLISAAPELLAAAIAKLADCDDCKDAALMEGEVCSDECAALATAIAKATGVATPATSEASK